MNEIDIDNLDETPQRCEKCGRSDVELCFEYVFTATARLCPRCEREWALIQHGLAASVEWRFHQALLIGLRVHGKGWHDDHGLKSAIQDEVAAELDIMQAFCRWLGESNDEHEN